MHPSWSNRSQCKNLNLRFNIYAFMLSFLNTAIESTQHLVIDPMALYPRQNSNFCLQHCCFELPLVSTLQYLTSTFNIAHQLQCNVHISNPIFNFYNSTLPIHNSMSIFQLQRCSNMRHSYPMFNVFIWCKMRYACNAIQHFCFLYYQSMSIFSFQISSFNMQHSCLSMQC